MTAESRATERITLRNRNVVVRRAFGRALIYAVLVIMSLVYFLPTWWMLITSVKTLKETFSFPPTFFPRTFTFEGYINAWEYMDWPLHFMNTMIIILGSLAGIVLTSTLCAFGFSRLRFPGRDTVFIIMLASMMLPSQVTIIPTYIVFQKLGWLDTFKPLIIPAWFGGGAFNIFLIRQFFASIPQDLVDAARIDGSSRLGIWWRIMLPLSKPALTAITVFTIQGKWNDFFGPLIYLNSKSKLTLALALNTFQTIAGSAAANAAYQDISLYTALMAAASVVTVPMIILFVVAQSYFVEGIQMTGLKG
ncbi:MAG: carbohydrate ABC transporter permease [Anaerolineae bacterium]|nr:carbohydrate ABC transporter permease [Anaerolineae bacterium]